MPSVPLMSARPSFVSSLTVFNLAGGPAAAGPVQHLAFADQRETDMGEWGEVSAAADRAVARHYGRDSLVQHPDQRIGEQRPYARQTHRQGAGTEQHRRPDDLGIHRRPNTGRVRPDERQLQLRLAERRDARAGQGPKTRRHAVDRFP